MTDHFKTIRDALVLYGAFEAGSVCYRSKDALTSLSQLQKERQELVDGLTKYHDAYENNDGETELLQKLLAASEEAKDLLEKLRGGQ